MEVTLVEETLFGVPFVKGLVEAGLRGATQPASSYAPLVVASDRRYGCASGLKAALDMHHASINYCFLLDREGRVRWRATGGVAKSHGGGEAMAAACDALLEEALATR